MHNKKKITKPLMNTHPCPHFPVCSGCTQPFSEEKPDLFTAISFFQKLGCPAPYSHGNFFFWRTRSKLAVAPQGIGLYKKNSHTVIPIPECLVHHPSINKAVAILQDVFSRLKITAYNELSHMGVVRYLQVTVERASQAVSVVFVVNAGVTDPVLAPLRALCMELQQYNPLFHSFAFNSNPVRGNTIFTTQWEHIIGPQYTYETLCGVQFPFSYRHFMQANLEMYEQAAAALVSHIPPQAKVLELYGGMGVLGLLATQKAQHVHISDITEEAYTSWQEAHKQLVPTLQTSCTYCVGDAKQVFSTYSNCDTLIVDPPRKGLSAELLIQIKQSRITTLLYLSCSFDSLQRDIILLQEAGFSVVFAEIYDFFPGTGHLELLVKLKK